MKVRNAMGSTFSGTIGKDTVAVEGPTANYLRAYVVPHDPKSERQLEQRDRLARALAAWQDMSLLQEAFYRHLEKPKAGYHVFMGRAIDALVAGQPIETPVRMAWTVEGGPVERGRLLVRRYNTTLFEPHLAATVEVALTPSDAPYTLVLTKGAQEDEVLILRREGVTATPPTLESATLGIRLLPIMAPSGPTPVVSSAENPPSGGPGAASESPRGDPTTERRALAQEFARHLKARYGDRIEKVILFGSAARGEAREDSDVDLLVVAAGDWFALQGEVTGDAVDWLLRSGVYLSVKVFTPEEFVRLRETGFGRNVMSEGVTLA